VIVEALAPFRGAGELRPSMLLRGGRPLALAELQLDERVSLLDLDDPRVLTRERLRPSQVATRARAVTQRQSAELFERHERSGGLLWWSTFEASWRNVTLFDRAAGGLEARSCTELGLDDPRLVEAAELLGLRLPS
jgi:hypothetical protein